MVALASWIESEESAVADPFSYPEKTDTPSKNRVGDFFGRTPDRVGETPSQVVERVGVLIVVEVRPRQAPSLNGRIYDPLLGRFLSADILVPSPGDLQSYNRYSYVRNNPLSRIDPSGYKDLSQRQKDFAAGRTRLFGAPEELQNNQVQSKQEDEIPEAPSKADDVVASFQRAAKEMSKDLDSLNNSIVIYDVNGEPEAVEANVASEKLAGNATEAVTAQSEERGAFGRFLDRQGDRFIRSDLFRDTLGLALDLGLRAQTLKEKATGVDRFEHGPAFGIGYRVMNNGIADVDITAGVEYTTTRAIDDYHDATDKAEIKVSLEGILVDRYKWGSGAFFRWTADTGSRRNQDFQYGYPFQDGKFDVLPEVLLPESSAGYKGSSLELMMGVYKIGFHWD